MNTSQSQEQTASMNAATAQVLAQSQALMMQLLDLQKWQQQVALRFIDTHQQLMLQCVSGTPLPTLPLEAMPALIPAVAEVAAPAVVPAAVPAPAQAAPAPVVRTAGAPTVIRTSVGANRVPAATVPRAQTVSAPAEKRAVPMNGQNGTGHHTNGTASASKPAPAAKAAAPAATAPAAAAAPAVTAQTNNGEYVPPVEEFRAALLRAVSERTGYPEDMLDESLPLEAGLGIDSIKTVEIFSNLKDYHRFFQRDGEDEEEAIKEFMQLKTLGDIISAYELQHQAHSAGQSAGATTVPSANGSHSQVERYTLDAVEAPALNGE